MKPEMTISEEWYEAEPVTIKGLTIEYFNYHAEQAKAQGCTHWATQTNRESQPWTTVLFFFKPLEDS